MSAVETGNFELLGFLTKEFPPLEFRKACNAEGQNAFHHAAKHGQDLIIYMLGELGLDVN